jgi:hypothetical protein
VLSHPDLTGTASVAWLDAVAGAFRQGAPEPVPAWASDTMRTLRMLYVLADRGVRARNTDEPARSLTHRAAVPEALAATPAIGAPYAG